MGTTATRFGNKAECQAAIDFAGLDYSNPIWVGPIEAVIDGIASGWYAFCNDRRRFSL